MTRRFNVPAMEPVEGRPNAGKDYVDYIKDEEAKNGPIRRARMQAAIDARKARIAAGIDISVNHNDITKAV